MGLPRVSRECLSHHRLRLRHRLRHRLRLRLRFRQQESRQLLALATLGRVTIQCNVHITLASVKMVAPSQVLAYYSSSRTLFVAPLIHPHVLSSSLLFVIAPLRNRRRPTTPMRSPREATQRCHGCEYKAAKG